MSLFQISLLLVLTALAAALALALKKRRLTPWAGCGWSALLLIGALFTAWPDSTTVLARLLGIGRGVDLLFYCAIMMTAVGFLLVYIQFRSMRRELTVLVRQIAHLTAQRNLDKSDRDSDRP